MEIATESDVIGQKPISKITGTMISFMFISIKKNVPLV